MMSRIARLAFIVKFPPQNNCQRQFLAPKLRVRNVGQASIFPVFAANRSPAARRTAVIRAPYQ